ncbi:MAG: sulfatase [Planctomycetales bacterium]|nr:sulfatase [Planctomycetales bacterium]
MVAAIRRLLQFHRFDWRGHVARLHLVLVACALTNVSPRLAIGAEPDSTVASAPNIVVMLADDLGYGDLACYGSEVLKTPNIDRLAAEGLRLTDCYAAAPNCSPARAGLMTGRAPWRLGIHNWIPMLSPVHVRREEITIATLLRRAGYATCHVGKWHLNGRFNMAGQPQPSDHGFEHWFSTQNNSLPNHRNPNNFIRNGQAVGQLHGYSARLVAGEAIRWLQDHCETTRERRQPFFLFACFHEPHEPIATDPQLAAWYPSSDDPSRAAHHGNVSQLDESIGRLLQAIDDLGLRDETFVVFTSDNGPAITRIHPHGSAGPLRDKKGSMYEGGIRVPGIVRWPRHTQPGSVSNEPVSGVDLLPTLCAVAGAPVPADRAIDGASFLPIFESQPIVRTKPLYWQFNRATSKPKVAMRMGDWKILAHLDTPELRPGVDQTAAEMKRFKTADLTTFELYNLRNDISETTDVAAEQPERLATMAATLRESYYEMRDESPVWPAWEWTHYEGQRIEWPDYWEKRHRPPAK